VLGALGVALAGVLAVVLFVGVGTQPSQPEVAPGISPAAAYLLKLQVETPPVPTAGFTLTDQHGRPVSLLQFRGKSVVLSFNDDQCTDICTLLAEDVIVANRDLGPAAKDVVFLSVNANPYYPSVAAVRSWSDQHGLGPLANWEFVTGSPAALQSVWKDYGVTVQLDPVTRTVVHSTVLYFIGPDGKERAIGEFGISSADTGIFSHTMAQMAADALAASERPSVAGPSVLTPSQSDVAIGARVPTFTLPLLRGRAGLLSSASLRGRYAVLNFWSSTCTACVREMPAIETAYRDLGARVAFVGIDVSDAGSAARAFASRLKVSYPLVSDASGAVTSAYQIPELPFTAILSPNGALKTLHPGAMTTEQLEYLVKNLDPALATSP